MVSLYEPRDDQLEYLRCFRQKLCYRENQYMTMIAEKIQNHFKITFVFLNGMMYFLLH